MARAFGSTPIAVEINGNQYHLPDSLTAWLRIEASKEITAYEKADALLGEVLRDLEWLPRKVTDETTPEEMTKLLDDADKKAKDATVKQAAAAVNLIVKLLKSVDGKDLPEDLAKHVSEPIALEFASTLVNRGQIEPDPQ